MVEKSTSASYEDKAEALNSMLMLLMHDISNPLNIAMSANRMALHYAEDMDAAKECIKDSNDTEDMDAVKECIKDSNDALEVMASILLFIQRYAMGRDLEKEEFSLNTLCSITTASGVPPELLTLEKSEDIKVNASKYGLGLALTNLVKNGIEASDGKAPVKVSFTKESGIAKVVVKDAGKGMRPEEAESYGQLSTTKSDKNAVHGLGNRIVADLVQRMGITLSVESELGVGTSITLTLPK